jgi:hypothetical protein
VLPGVEWIVDDPGQLGAGAAGARHGEGLVTQVVFDRADGLRSAGCDQGRADEE